MTWTEIPDIELFSDGGAKPNPGKGGFFSHQKKLLNQTNTHSQANVSKRTASAKPMRSRRHTHNP